MESFSIIVYLALIKVNPLVGMDTPSKWCIILSELTRQRDLQRWHSWLLDEMMVVGMDEANLSWIHGISRHSIPESFCDPDRGEGASVHDYWLLSANHFDTDSIDKLANMEITTAYERMEFGSTAKALRSSLRLTHRCDSLAISKARIHVALVRIAIIDNSVFAIVA